MRLDWRSSGLTEFAGEAFVLLATDPQDLLSGRIEPVELSGGSTILGGFPTGVELFASLGLAPEPGDPIELTGPVLSARTGAPIYASPTASGVGADGLTPETAFPNLFVAVLTANLAGGGNVYVAEGTFTGVSVPLLAGVDLYGGFPPSFSLAERSPTEHETVLAGLPNLNVLTMEVGGELQRVDGLTLDGVGEAATGLDLDRTPAQLSTLLIRGASRGIRVRASDFVDPTPALVVNVISRNNDLEGLSLDGPYDLVIDSCGFFNNGQEGVECGPWIAPIDTEVHLTVRDSSFSGNGFEGLDVDLAPPVALGAPGAFFLDIEDCDFEENRAAGCLIDLDYEFAPGWTSTFSVRGCLSRANLGPGFMLDLDGSFDGILHRVFSNSNGGDGVLLTAESYADHLVVSASAFVANQGAGIRTSLGNVGIALSHSLVSGNRQGGFVAITAPGTAMSSAAHLQPQASSKVGLRGTPVLTSGSVPFQYSPVEFQQVVGITSTGVSLAGALASAPGLACELAGDEQLRLLGASAGTQATVSPAPVSLQLPSTLAVFPAATSVSEDYKLRAGSALIEAGVATPEGAPVDAGIFGSPLGGAPGLEDPESPTLFYAAQTTPAWNRPIGANQPFRIEFTGGSPDSGSVAGGVSLIDASGVDWPLDVTVEGAALVVSAPAAGWAVGDRIELHGSLFSEEGAPCIPLSIPVGSFQP